MGRFNASYAIVVSNLIDMTENNQETRSIAEIFKLISTKKLTLPEFQRDFKWPIEKSVALFDSLNRNLFIGSLILAIPKFDLACKGFDLRPRGSKKHKPKPSLIKRKEFENKGTYTLLDGQQRTTAIYRALLGIDEIYYWFKPFDTLTSKDYYDFESRKVKKTLEDYIEYVDTKQPKEQILSIKIGDLYSSIDNDESDFLEDYIEPQLDDFALDQKDKNIARKFASALLRDFRTQIVHKEKLLSIQLLDMPLEKFCLFFERSNSQGMNLSFVDIVNAKVYIDFKLSREISKAKSDFKFFDDKLVDPIVRYINFLSSGEVTKDSILKNLQGSDFKEHWNNCVEDINYIQKWLEENNWAFQVDKMPYRTMLLPLLSFYQNLPKKEFTQATQEQMDQLKFWFFASLIDNRFGGGSHGSTNVVIKKDCEILRDLAHGKKIDKEYWSKIRITADFEGYKRKDNAKSASVMGLTFFMWHSENFKNLENNANVSMSAKVDVHHIIPEDYVKNKFGENSDEYDFVDSILNKIRINKISNIKISNKSPKTYLTEIKNKSNPDIVESLKTHSVYCGDDLLNGKFDNDFFGFLKKRYEGIEKFISKISIAGDKLSNGDVKDLWK